MVRQYGCRLPVMSARYRPVLAGPAIARTTPADHSRSNVVNRLTFLTNARGRGEMSLLYAAPQDVPGNSCIGPVAP
jgi:hypothetical protein